MLLFPGITPEAEIAGDLELDDVSCPYCASTGCCKHLVAIVDPLNLTIGGRAFGLEREFAIRVSKAFTPLLRNLDKEVQWSSEDIAELWVCASSNWSSDSDEPEIDWDVLMRVASELLSEAGTHTDFGSQLEGDGVETEYTLVYDENPLDVIERSIMRLDQLLKPVFLEGE